MIKQILVFTQHGVKITEVLSDQVITLEYLKILVNDWTVTGYEVA